MRKAIQLREHETAALIEASDGRPLPLRFSASGVWLAGAGAPWAAILLRELRGETVSDGGGI